jgi:hypothetical protein
VNVNTSAIKPASRSPRPSPGSPGAQLARAPAAIPDAGGATAEGASASLVLGTAQTICSFVCTDRLATSPARRLLEVLKRTVVARGLRSRLQKGDLCSSTAGIVDLLPGESPLPGFGRA